MTAGGRKRGRKEEKKKRNEKKYKRLKQKADIELRESRIKVEKKGMRDTTQEKENAERTEIKKK